MFDGGFEFGLGEVVEPVVDAAFGDAVVLAEGGDGEFAVGFAWRLGFEAVVELNVVVELVEVGKGLNEGEGLECGFIHGVASDVGEVCGI